MKKKILSTLLSVAMVASIVGCGAPKESPADTDVATEEEVAEGSGEETAATGGELIVYSPAPEDLLNAVIQEFQDKTGIKVELIQAGSGELLTRIKSESNNPLADVMFGGGAEGMEAHKEFFEPYESPEAANVMEAYKSTDGTWTGAFVSPTVIMYNKNLVAEGDVPTGWKDFGDEKWTGQIAWADPVVSGSSFTTLSILLAAMDNGTDGGWDFIRNYVKVLDGNLLSSSSAPHKGVADGEYSMCIIPEQAVLQYTEAGADYIDMVYPEEGTGAVPSAISIIKGAKNVDNAKLFVDFVLSSDVQSRMSDYMYRTVRTDVTEEGGLKPMSEIKMADFDFIKASTEKDNYIQKWNDIIIGK